MPKVKIPRKSTIVDMTAMCDVSFLLLTFFILTAKFKPQSIVAVDVPTARTTRPVDNAITITVNKEGKAFISVKEKSTRYAMLEKLVEFSGDHYPGIKDLTQTQKEFFSLSDTWGTPIGQTKQVTSLNGLEFKKYQEEQMAGIPYDSTSNELGDWVMAARYATGGDIKIAIKGDKDSDVEYVKQVIKRLTEKDIHRFVLITSLAAGGDAAEAAPAEGGEPK
ncbi:MAG TPA: biopolymer transporter ExbD [Chitinophagales bacterium]|nr:biopolymer transporter ExbD [Chitinophagales bacterium]HLP53346.1 biopolymer transporter ExbD [Chitinophagales bacterium]